MTCAKSSLGKLPTLVPSDVGVSVPTHNAWLTSVLETVSPGDVGGGSMTVALSKKKKKLMVCIVL